MIGEAFRSGHRRGVRFDSLLLRPPPCYESVIVPPLELDPTRFANFVDTLQQQSPNAAQNAVRGLGQAVVVSFLRDHFISGITDLQHALALEAALDPATNIGVATRLNLECLFNPVNFGCPGKGTRTCDEVVELLKERGEALVRQGNSITPGLSLPTWRPWYRTWVRQMETAFNTMEEIIVSGMLCKRDPQEPICRISFPAMVTRCVRFEGEDE